MQKSVSKRIRVTKNGKVMRRATSLCHSRGNKSGNQLTRKKKSRGLVMHYTVLKKYL